jgi:hypothetical protein
VLRVGEDGRLKVNMPLILMPGECKEGDILDIAIEKDEKATVEATDRSRDLIERLKRKGQGKGGIIQ